MQIDPTVSEWTVISRFQFDAHITSSGFPSTDIYMGFFTSTCSTSTDLFRRPVSFAPGIMRAELRNEPALPLTSKHINDLLSVSVCGECFFAIVPFTDNFKVQVREGKGG